MATQEELAIVVNRQIGMIAGLQCFIMGVFRVLPSSQQQAALAEFDKELLLAESALSSPDSVHGLHSFRSLIVYDK